MKLNDQQSALLRKFDVETPAAYANDNYDKCEFQPSKALDDLPEFLFEDALAELKFWYDKYAVRYQPDYGTSSYLLKHDLSRILANKPGDTLDGRYLSYQRTDEGVDDFSRLSAKQSVSAESKLQNRQTWSASYS